MEFMRIAVCDDDAAALGIITASLKDIFTSHGIEAEVTAVPSAVELMTLTRRRKFDLIFLDIDMPELDGITFARDLRAQGDQVDIIYISNREDLVFDSLRVSPVGFIRKSRFLEDMSEIVGVYLDARASRHQVSSIVLHKGGLVRPLRADAIAFIEGRRKEQEVHLIEGGHITIRSSMHKLEEELVPAGFIRIHQGYLVNCRHIELIEDKEVILLSGEVLPISRRKATEVRERYLDFVQQDSNMVF